MMHGQLKETTQLLQYTTRKPSFISNQSTEFRPDASASGSFRGGAVRRRAWSPDLRAACQFSEPRRQSDAYPAK